MLHVQLQRETQAFQAPLRALKIKHWSIYPCFYEIKFFVDKNTETHFNEHLFIEKKSQKKGL